MHCIRFNHCQIPFACWTPQAGHPDESVHPAHNHHNRTSPIPAQAPHHFYPPSTFPCYHKINTSYVIFSPYSSSLCTELNQNSSLYHQIPMVLILIVLVCPSVIIPIFRKLTQNHIDFGADKHNIHCPIQPQNENHDRCKTPVCNRIIGKITYVERKCP